jgi:hypothetical protein
MKTHSCIDTHVSYRHMSLGREKQSSLKYYLASTGNWTRVSRVIVQKATAPQVRFVPSHELWEVKYQRVTSINGLSPLISPIHATTTVWHPNGIHICERVIKQQLINSFAYHCWYLWRITSEPSNWGSSSNISYTMANSSAQMLTLLLNSHKPDFCNRIWWKIHVVLIQTHSESQNKHFEWYRAATFYVQLRTIITCDNILDEFLSCVYTPAPCSEVRTLTSARVCVYLAALTPLSQGLLIGAFTLAAAAQLLPVMTYWVNFWGLQW